MNRILYRYNVNGMFIQTLIHFPTFLKNYMLLKGSQWWSKEEIESYQLDELKKLIKHSYENVPYYKSLFEKLGLKPGDIRSIKDLQKIPFLTKDIINKNIDKLKATNYKKSKLEHTYTGGSTGKPLNFYTERGVWLSNLMAYTSIQMKWINCSHFNKNVFITGSEKPYSYQMLHRILVLSSFYMNQEYMPQFIEKIRKLRPRYILGYPSAITTLAIFMQKNKIESFPSIKAIICSAETLYDWQKNLLEKTFKCHVFNQYALRESVAIGASCNCSDKIHIFSEYGITELVDKGGKSITKEGEIGEIVGTGFHTYVFPFIRYKTGDLGVFTKEKCKCGRNYLLLDKIEGRTQEFIVTKSKQVIPLTGIYGLIAKSSSNVSNCQLFQDTPGQIVIRIIKSSKYSKKDGLEIKNNFVKRFKNDIDIKIQFVEKIPLTDRGKTKFLVQKLPIDKYCV
jgi:phenylacetate-CoA ligase